MMRSIAVSIVFLGLTACAEKPAEAPVAAPAPEICDPVMNHIETAGRTMGAAAKTGAIAAADGVVQLGSATAGLVEDGASGAKAKWNERGAETTQEARDNADVTLREANRPACPSR